jgi:opacity protein-like surface antigen
MGSNRFIFAAWKKRLLLPGFALAAAFFMPASSQAQSSTARIIQPVAYRFGSDQIPFPAEPGENAYQASPQLPNTRPRFKPAIDRPGLIRRGRMVSSAIIRQEKVIDAQENRSNSAQIIQDPFGENQQTPKPPVNQFRPVVPPKINVQEGTFQESGKLPPDVFEDPFKNENRPGDKSVPTGPNLTQPANNKQGNNQDVDPPEPKPAQPQETAPAPPRPRKSKLDNGIDYQTRRGYNSLPSRSNVYQPPGSQPAQPFVDPGEAGVYFVPAYEPIPGLQAPHVAPPTNMYPENYSANPPSYHPPVPQGQPSYDGQWQPHLHQPIQTPPQTVYSEVVPAPAARDPQGPVAAVRHGLLGKIKSDLQQNWGIGDFSRQDSAYNSIANAPAFYFGFQGAGAVSTDFDNGSGSVLNASGGTAFMFALGRLNGKNLRTEAELSFRNNDVTSFSTPGMEFDFDGQLQTFSGMANAYWEFSNFPSDRIKPYIGAGVGFTSLTATLRDASGGSLLNTDRNSDSSFAYQWMAGLNFRAGDNLDFFGEYRFHDMESFQIRSFDRALSGDYGYSASSVGVGLRWKF